MAKARERVWLSLLRVCRVVYDVAIDTIGGLLEVFLEDFGLIVVLAHSRTVDGVSVGLLGLLLDEAIAEA